MKCDFCETHRECGGGNPLYPSTPCDDPSCKFCRSHVECDHCGVIVCKSAKVEVCSKYFVCPHCEREFEEANMEDDW